MLGQKKALTLTPRAKILMQGNEPSWIPEVDVTEADRGVVEQEEQ